MYPAKLESGSKTDSVSCFDDFTVAAAANWSSLLYLRGKMAANPTSSVERWSVRHNAPNKNPQKSERVLHAKGSWAEGVSVH